METILYCIVTGIGCFYLGFQFCKIRYMVDVTHEAMNIMCDIIRGRIDVEEGKKAFDKLFKDNHITIP